jgi:hypothetical protein
MLIGTTLQATVNDGAVVFFNHPANAIMAAALHARIDALGKGQLGGELNLVDAGGAADEDGESYGVTMMADHVGNHTVRLTAGSDEHDGKALVVRVDNDTLPGAPDQIEVNVNGTVFPHAGSAAEILNGSFGKAFVGVGNGAVEVTIGVPHFSTFAIVLTGIDSTMTPTPAPSPSPSPSGPNGTTPTPAPSPSPSGSAQTPGLPAGLLVLAVAAVAVAANRRQR